MATVDILIPSYRGIQPASWSSMTQMLRESQCNCTDMSGAPLHRPWECKRGRHSVLSRDHVSSCVVHWSRNMSVAEFLYKPGPVGRPPAEYALFVDDDMVVLPQYLNRLLSHKVDIVAGICTRRRDPPTPTIKMWKEDEQNFREVVEWDWDSQKLIEVDATGAAFILIRRKVFEAISEAFLSCKFEREADKLKFEMYKQGFEMGYEAVIDAHWDALSAKRRKIHADHIAQGQYQRASCWWFNFAWDPTGCERGQLGEDIDFCWKAKKLGFKVYADPQVCPGHTGEYHYSTLDYRQFLADVRANNPQLPQSLPENVPQLVAKD